jgi:hypothetical protein
MSDERHGHKSWCEADHDPDEVHCSATFAALYPDEEADGASTPGLDLRGVERLAAELSKESWISWDKIPFEGVRQFYLDKARKLALVYLGGQP